MLSYILMPLTTIAFFINLFVFSTKGFVYKFTKSNWSLEKAFGDEAIFYLMMTALPAMVCIIWVLYEYSQFKKSKHETSKS